MHKHPHIGKCQAITTTPPQGVINNTYNRFKRDKSDGRLTLSSKFDKTSIDRMPNLNNYYRWIKFKRSIRQLFIFRLIAGIINGIKFEFKEPTIKPNII